MYIESSSPRRRGDKARLNSPIYSRTTTPSCLKFWYNMNGRNIGTLNVYAVLSGRYQRIWSKSGVLWFCLFDLILYVPVNNFLVMLGQVFLG